MASLFAKRRKPRQIGVDEGEDANKEDASPVIKKPSSKGQRKTKVRQSHYTEDVSTGNDDEVEEEAAVVRPKKLGLAKRALEQSATQRAGISTGPSTRDGTPSYSKEELQALKESTPALPQEFRKREDEAAKQNKEVDVTAKFGEMVQVSGPVSIPSEVEIREKKERRARLAKEYAAEDYIPLEDDVMVGSDEDWALAQNLGREDNAGTRLVRDDEDFAEGFDDYVEDGKIALGKRAERDFKRKQRNEMKELIEAEGTSDEEDSEAENRAAYEAAQTRAAMYGSKSARDVPPRPTTPPKITPLPRLSDSILRLRTSLGAMQNTKAQLLHRMEELRQEKSDIANREVEIQALLKEAGEKYEKLKLEAGVPAESNDLSADSGVDANKGLEGLGTLQSVPQSPSDVEMTSD